jgi:hypothetical protein
LLGNLARCGACVAADKCPLARRVGEVEEEVVSVLPAEEVRYLGCRRELEWACWFVADRVAAAPRADGSLGDVSGDLAPPGDDPAFAEVNVLGFDALLFVVGPVPETDR